MTIDYYFGEDEEHYEFEPDYKDIINKIIDLFANEYCVSEDISKRIILNFGLDEKCFEIYQDELKDYYKDEAYESWLSENEVDNKHNCEV